MMLSQRVRTIEPSATLGLNATLQKLRAEGRDIVNFSVGEPDFDTPAAIRQAGIDAIEDALTVNRSLCSLRHPQHGKAVNHDSLERLHDKLERNWQALREREPDVTQEDLTTPRSTQAILSVYRTA